MVKELKIRDFEALVEAVKDQIKKIYETDNIKFVGIEFHFLVDDEIPAKFGIFAEGYDPNEFEEVDSDA